MSAMLPVEKNDGDVECPFLLPAAEYIRMSTELQQYSTANQHQKIFEYAVQHGIEIIRSYVDEGKSGLSFSGRPALQSLIRDVESGSADFQTILVFDISRWGRFQDADESAFYEFLCRRAGIQVIYCAEQFTNDGSILSNVIKGLKRAMASEYSRELSAKTFAGQCRCIEMGFHQGGPPGFGLRRILVDQQGTIKGELAHREKKYLRTDHVVLAPGPEIEIKLVNDVYHWFIDDRLNEFQIAARLNTMGVFGAEGRAWTDKSIRNLLTNEKYIGTYVFAQTAYKLRGSKVRNPPQAWIKKEKAFPSIVPHEVFLAAQKLMHEHHRRSDTELIDHLRGLYQKHGRLSIELINGVRGMPNAEVYKRRFGSLLNAYQAVDYAPHYNYHYAEVKRFLHRLQQEIIAEVETTIRNCGGTVKRNDAAVLRINDEITISFVLAVCKVSLTGCLYWKVQLKSNQDVDLTIAIRLDQANRSARDYYAFPRLDFAGTSIRLGERNSIEYESYHFDDLEWLGDMANCTHTWREK